jgi:hypothetical protein
LGDGDDDQNHEELTQSRGGMDLRDEVAGTEGTNWLNHFRPTGFEMFTSGQGGGYVAEKAEAESGWQFPVSDEVGELSSARRAAIAVSSELACASIRGAAGPAGRDRAASRHSRPRCVRR